MQIGLNMRGDIAKLNVAEIERRFENLMAERVSVEKSIDNFSTRGNKVLYEKGLGMQFGRGLIRSPVFYRIYAVINANSSVKGLGRLYMIDCELKDLMDECRRRLRNEKRSIST